MRASRRLLFLPLPSPRDALTRDEHFHASGSLERFDQMPACTKRERLVYCLMAHEFSAHLYAVLYRSVLTDDPDKGIAINFQVTDPVVRENLLQSRCDGSPILLEAHRPYCPRRYCDSPQKKW
jgi:hypothetical protein